MLDLQALTARRHGPLNIERVLVVVDVFPASGGSRIDKLVKLLPEFGIEPIVLCSKDCDTPRSQRLRQDLYPPSLKVYHARPLGWSYFAERFLMRGPDAQHYQLLKVLSFPERCLLVPDYRVRWIPRGMKLARRIVEQQGIMAVLSSSPPESSHIIGLYLKRKLGIRWVADFRDLWTEKTLLYRPPTPLHDRWIRHLEQRIFSSADHIIANTEENASRYVQRFGVTPNRLTVVPNGFDREDLPPTQSIDRGEVFRIGYAGSLDKHDFPWRLALNAIKQLSEEVGRRKVRLVQCGYVSKQVKNYLSSAGIEDLVELHGELPHAAAMKLTACTDLRLVLLYENEYSASIVPMKLYNYLIMNGPILAIAPEQGATASVIEKTRMGKVISANQGAEAVCAALRHFYLRWELGLSTISPDHAQIAMYDRRHHAQQIAKILTATDRLA